MLADTGIPETQNQDAGRQMIERFVRRFDETYRKLAAHAALPLVLTPELLSYLRTQFVSEAPWVAEADLLLSDLCRLVGYEQYMLDMAVRAYLLDYLKQEFGVERMKAVARLLINYVHRLSQSDPTLGAHELQTQQWAAMVCLDDQRETAVSQIVQAMWASAMPQSKGTGDERTGPDQAEIARLIHLTQMLAPQLERYPELVGYARQVSRLLTEPMSAESKQLRRNKHFSQPVRIQGTNVELPPLRILIEPSVTEKAKPVATRAGIRQRLAAGIWNRYVNFDIHLEPKEAFGYPVKAESHLGQAHSVFSLDIAIPEIATTLRARSQGRVGEATMRALGKKLADNLMNGEVAELFHRTLGAAQATGKTRLRLSITPPELTTLPWELLWIGEDPLCVSTQHVVTRFIESKMLVHPMIAPRPLRMLGIIPQSSGLNTEKEKAALKKAVEWLGGALQVTWLEGVVSRERIRDTLGEAEYHIVHFIGHGNMDGHKATLRLNDEYGDDYLIPAETFSGFFRDSSVRLLVLNASRDAAQASTGALVGVAPQVVQHGVPAVVAMQWDINDRMIQQFAQAFYRSLCVGPEAAEVDTAVTKGRAALYANWPGSSAFAAPVLFLGTEHGQLWESASVQVERTDRLSVGTTLPRVLLVTVTRTEVNAVLDTFVNATSTPWKRKVVDGKGYYSLGPMGGVDVYMVQSELSGSGAAPLTIQEAIKSLSPVAVIMVGIAFGTKPKEYQIGDILISRQIQAYEQQKIKNRRRTPRGDRVTASTRLLDKFRSSVKDWSGAPVHFGLILSGEKLNRDQAFVDKLLRLEPEAIGGEMEGSGLYSAAGEAKVDWVVVKAISDWGDERKNHQHQQLAARNAAAYTLHVIRNGLGYSHAKSSKVDFVQSESKSLIETFNPTLFVGREDILHEIEEWATANVVPHRLLNIKAGPGYGKTWLLHAVYQRLAARENIFPILANAGVLSSSLQAVETWLSDLIAEARLRLDQSIRDYDPSAPVDLVMRELLEDLWEIGRRPVLIVDGWDEASEEQRKLLERKILAAFLSEDYVRILVTMRDDFYLVSASLRREERSLKLSPLSAQGDVMRLRLQSESVTSDRWVHANETNLPPPSYTKLFGRNQPISRLVEQLLKMGPPWITAIVGIGGIGKTAVADAVIRQVIRDFRFERVVWLRVDPYPAKAPTLTFEATLAKLAEFLSPQLPKNISPSEEIAHVQSILKANSHLVVIDNVEREADAANLLERLKDLASPSKFLLTSRTHLLGQADVFVTSLDELSPKDALDLLRHQASTIGLGDLANIDKTGMAPIYEVVGGNPLAIKIVVGLAVAQPLSQILVELRSNRPRDIENLYLQIFWKAWQALTPHARALLQAMPLVVEPGALPAQMQAISKLPEAQFWAAITELVTWSLLEVRGTAQERRYGIHRLTETFLRTEIIRSH